MSIAPFDYIGGDEQQVLGVLLDRLLLTGEESSVPMRAEDIAAECGIKVENHTHLAVVLVGMKHLMERGYLESSKIDEQLAYALTRLGERACLLDRIEHERTNRRAAEERGMELATEVRGLTRSLAHEKARGEYAAVMVAEWEAWASRPLWKKLLRRGKKPNA